MEGLSASSPWSTSSYRWVGCCGRRGVRVCICLPITVKNTQQVYSSTTHSALALRMPLNGTKAPSPSTTSPLPVLQVMQSASPASELSMCAMCILDRRGNRHLLVCVCVFFTLFACWQRNNTHFLVHFTVHRRQSHHQWICGRCARAVRRCDSRRRVCISSRAIRGLVSRRETRNERAWILADRVYRITV
jgi:hypothetical protein